MKKVLVNILCAFIPSKKCRHILRYVGLINYIKLYIRHLYPLKSFENFISIASIIKNEAPYLPEWIEYHKMLGVEKFYIYDNESTDNTKEVLKSYIADGTVEYIWFPGKKMQPKAYLDAVLRTGSKTHWLVLIDADEFIVPVKNLSIVSVIKNIYKKQKNISQILMGWVVYGSSGHKTKPDGLVIENYKNRGKFEDSRYSFKAIVNPRKVKIPDCHSCSVRGNTIDENGNVINIDIFSKKIPSIFSLPRNRLRLNHYMVKSYEECYNKRCKGNAWNGKNIVAFQDYFNCNDRNEVFDDIMSKYIKPIKQNLKKRRLL